MSTPQLPSQAPGYWPGTAPAAGGFVSPVPMRKATLADAVLAEWTKIRSVRSTMWTLGVMVALIVGVGMLIAVAVQGSSPAETNTASPLALGFIGVLLATICVITLGVLTISSEYGTGLIRTTLTACPSRSRVLTAKAVVFSLLTLVITLVSTLAVAAVHSSVLGSRSTYEPTGGDWLRATVGVSLFMALLGLLSLAVGALVRHSAGAITIMLGVVLLPMILALFMMMDSLRGVRDALLQYSIPAELAVLYGTASGTGAGPTGWEPVWIMAGLAAVGLAGAYAALARRDA
ncbi:ABC transporter permease subunit [Streptomyces morookaense]|uniref:ABC transporter permease subunit n=1 Tax=Streptomyces morookaense TaxID=1970 RepID=A0A7Y7E9W5_STRMO|nr:ABC transporter permease subunit [Streptomyces morookaense]NVK80879.1 ABC transporter permease subunit [Streptomyces morookaense]GHF13354.1 ABC transporter [Streptomyces morookaense]